MADPQELAVIKEVLDGERDQYRLLVERYHRGLIQHLYNLLGDEQSAEDMAQEAFISAYNKLSQYNQTYAFSTWLYKIADNYAYKYLKKSSKVALVGDSSDFDNQTSDVSIPDNADLVLTKEAVRRAINSLPANYKQVIAMYYWDNFNYEQIADIVGHPVGTVRTWLYRAKEELRKELYGQV